jgi:hypothetical protein
MEPLMPSSPAEERAALDFPRLQRDLHALASGARLQLLWELRVPKRPSEVRVGAEESRGGLRPDRVLSRSAVQEHIGVLEELGLVQRVAGGDTFVVNQQGVVRILNDLGALARIRPVIDVDVGRTVMARAPAIEAAPAGPKLILVSGPEEGAAFPLRGPGPWTVGRGNNTDVRLGYDPHASRVHVAVSLGEDGLYHVEAVSGATNPTLLDFAPLTPGKPAMLIPGAVLSVGSSRLVFRGV